MKKPQVFLLILSLLCLSSFKSFAQDNPYGIVNFSLCIEESHHGKQEQEAFEKLKTQMTTLMGDIEKQLNEIAVKFQDADFVDSLSPEAEQEIKARYQTLGEELNRYQNQYVQLMQQANMKLMQTMNNHVAQASETVAKRKNLPMIVREDLCFHYNSELDITPQVIEEMNKNFEKESQQTAQAEPTQQ